MGVMVGQLVEEYHTGCHLLLITGTRHSLLTSTILRYLHKGVVPIAVAEIGLMFYQDQLAQTHLLKMLWGDTKTTCRGLILDFTITYSIDLTLRLLEAAGLWMLPETVVVVVGRRNGVKDVLLHHSFRNTVNALYLTLHDLTLHDLSHHNLTLHDPQRHHFACLRRGLTLKVRGDVWVYRRCLYCNSGEADVQLVQQSSPTSLFHLSKNLFIGDGSSVAGVLSGHNHRVQLIINRSPHNPG
ncbi:uncharacterized protein [Cherax quadricarinatus]|uniref:uncharacterized protein n=1 Tax=Cherax quadricarinatus TaxID=27406 RepID=UPI00387E7805